ncbi:MAG: cytochrome C biogenesis protein [Candidatus Dactylopiibacterium carminicum]|uniref:Cytochrome c-type biogenesis protein n=2 Tax=Candidatus Dactylopiibacterium carminicum TaxID=857335 RepID=A0A272EXI6_9RHOO|nr:cytochrome c-type biogenesis protein CcmH [Candidatus Dactylopiibacterium carminicum]PAS94834.1 MAG: cytochrome C biogenesis protein [Candidatus Dactylopiibacterium carminicum]PAS97758.1 MAG: cytochrome C biogenesis protein [Candidatus Dactylopiibacterium carminicum]PAT00234.1 MAG: cytochrome C biogenesis protein [Candidatus Dactylopiibacterium carminicum]
MAHPTLHFLRGCLLALCCLLAVPTSWANADASLDARAQRLAEQLRCVVCQNQSIAESDADLARDLRRQVSEMLAAGQDEAAVRAFMVERYGDFVLYDPPLKAGTLLLWLGPLLLFASAVGAFAWRLRHLPRGPQADAAARARARALLKEDDPA